MLGGDQTFSQWVDGFIKEAGKADIALVLLVMSKYDRLSEPERVVCASIKDVIVKLSPNQVVLTVTRCEEELDDDEKTDWT